MSIEDFTVNDGEGITIPITQQYAGHRVTKVGSGFISVVVYERGRETSEPPKEVKGRLTRPPKRSRQEESTSPHDETTQPVLQQHSALPKNKEPIIGEAGDLFELMRSEGEEDLKQGERAEDG
ncbi:hypothetical protein SISNIDRAFT_464818 [Sistotremastrum niveocremeum HHB9708]|uniref:Uncharacterized protein n=1 Tax=Sistotremastrum niveocremeum HHB9708 TaxID=1314777 RepID=A0A164WLX6_9AGAM|nr:hypothetical protein SISNIDRAFT_464818 [Sistotremastrum niveocremeum HHB9708]